MQTEQRFRATIFSRWESNASRQTSVLGLLGLTLLVGAIALPALPLHAQSLTAEPAVNEAAPTTPLEAVPEWATDQDELCQPVGNSGARACRMVPASGNSQPAEAVPSVGQATLPFSDVPPDHWAYEALLFLSSP